MKYTLLLALASLATTAAAETQLYGTLSSGWEAEQRRSPDGRIHYNHITDRDSHIGFKGSFSFGGDTRLIWQAEQAASATTPSFQEHLQRQRQNNTPALPPNAP
ncbi:putative porin [Neisseria sp. HSC-16F19]|nr:hypothetical protein [Neisseria sp. HSC-16F19]MCP2040202.1 putative porin [Neisseria sp. HSC-16F19]